MAATSAGEGATPDVRSGEELANENDASRLKRRQCLQHFRYERKQVGKSIRPRSKNKHRDASPRKILLFWNSAIHRDEDIELVRHGVQEMTVVKIAPAHMVGRSDLVKSKMTG